MYFVVLYLAFLLTVPELVAGLGCLVGGAVFGTLTIARLLPLRLPAILRRALLLFVALPLMYRAQFSALTFLERTTGLTAANPEAPGFRVGIVLVALAVYGVWAWALVRQQQVR